MGAGHRPQHTTYGGGVDATLLATLNRRWIAIASEEPQKRGFAFEVLLGEIFGAFGLAPRASFRLVGEQVDGSFQFNSDVYLLEAKWHAQPTPQSDLLVFREKVESKSAWIARVICQLQWLFPGWLGRICARTCYKHCRNGWTRFVFYSRWSSLTHGCNRAKSATCRRNGPVLRPHV